MKKRQRKGWRRNGGLKIGGCMRKGTIQISWELEIAIHRTIRNEDKNGSALLQSFSVA
jgi:hypothetical protein